MGLSLFFSNNILSDNNFFAFFSLSEFTLIVHIGWPTSIWVLILGIFGDSKKERLKNAAAEKARFEAEVEKEKEKLR